MFSTVRLTHCTVAFAEVLPSLPALAYSSRCPILCLFGWSLSLSFPSPHDLLATSLPSTFALASGKGLALFREAGELLAFPPYLAPSGGFIHLGAASRFGLQEEL